MQTLNHGVFFTVQSARSIITKEGGKHKKKWNRKVYNKHFAIPCSTLLKESEFCIMKKFVSLLLALVTLFSVLAIPAAAASTKAFDILSDSAYAKTYTLSTSGKTYPYTKSNLKDRGTVTYGKSSSSYIANSSDELYVFDVGTTGGTYWAKVSYPTSSRRVIAYIPLSAISPNNASHEQTTSTGKFYCALRSGSALNSNYYVAKGDTVYLVATSGNRCQILYNISGGKWRLAWCEKSDYNKYCTTPAGMTDVTAQFANKKITLKSVQNGKYLSADANYSSTPLVANRSSAATWETFTVSSVTSDGWVAFKAAANGKYLTANRDATNGPVQAIASKIQGWECFRIYKKGNDYYIKAQANNKWLCVRIDTNNTPVQAYASAPSTWERIQIQVISDGSATKPAVNSSSLVSPVPSGCKFTKTSNDNGWKGHHDININVSKNTPVYAIASGTVTLYQRYVTVGGTKSLVSYGNFAELKCDNGYTAKYCHLDRFNGVSQIVPSSSSQRLSQSDAQKQGTVKTDPIKTYRVNAGDIIGYIGTTGNSTGVHLHFELYKNGSRVDPVSVFPVLK